MGVLPSIRWTFNLPSLTSPSLAWYGKTELSMVAHIHEVS